MIETLLGSLGTLAVAVIEKSGYAGLFILSALESAAIPIPSEIVVPFAGYLAFIGKFSLVGAILIINFGNLAGSIILYFIGASGGRYLLEIYGKYILMSKHDLEIADRWFKKHGGQVIFWARMLPGVRTFISISAGVTKMDFVKFSILTFLGSLPWNAGLAIIGYKGGKNWRYLYPYFQKFNLIIVLAVVGLVIWYIARHLKHRHV